MDMPKPTAEHARLERLAGTWTGEERIHPSEWAPDGAVALGRVRNVIALDGFALIQDYEQERDGRVVFRGHGVLRWDTLSRAYVMHWFDSLGQGASEFRGDFEGDVLTVTSREATGLARASWELGERDRYRYRMEVSADGTLWFPLIEGTYTREG